jgi:cell division protein FtsI/penicillin-binding protein 2
MTASSLQLAQAYSVFANDGYLKDFKIFQDDVEGYKQRVIGKDAANDVLKSLKLLFQMEQAAWQDIQIMMLLEKRVQSHKASSKGGYDQSKYIASLQE